MIIYGHSGQDIRRMIWRRKFKLLTVAVLILVAVALMGCTVGNKKISPPLQALDKFWDTLGSGKDKTKKDSAEVE
tara:strand:+ start:469 stop:693 length:225 start_codon:yes stop_codon:yes gene_type:complete